MTSAQPFSSRKFPNLGWAWPSGRRDQLLVAAICPDECRALASIEAWLQETDLDDATFAEHRLLAAITTRFDALLSSHPEYARLCGLQRLNWTKSRMALASVMPALQEMATLGLRPILLKGACRVALDPSEQKSRTSYDLDLLLASCDFAPAFEVLAARGWKSTRGESTLGLRARISSVNARNFKHGQFGDIDLHRTAYHAPNVNSVLDEQLLSAAMPVEYYGLPLRVPIPEERLAMAIGHGGWDGHNHSDWLVDAARILEQDAINWDKFTSIVVSRRLIGASAVALSYLHYQIGLEIPAKVRDSIFGTSSVGTPAQVASMFLAKEAEQLSSSQRLVRKGIESFHKLRHSGRNKALDTPVFRTFTKVRKDEPGDHFGFNYQVLCRERAATGLWSFSITLQIPAPSKTRRVELELNGQDRNICHFQAFHFRKSGASALIKFNGRIEIDENDFPIVISALPSKLIETVDSKSEIDKYGAIAFSVIAADFHTSSSHQ